MNYRRILQKLRGRPLLESNIHLGKKLHLFEVMRSHGKPMTVQSLAEQAALKERYVEELVHSYIASEVIGVTANKEIQIPDWDVFKEEILDRDLRYHDAFKEVSPILENCITAAGPSGYSHDEAPYVMEYIRSLRTLTLPALAKVIASLIKQNTESQKEILDLGCGYGDLAIPLANQMKGAKIHGCDISVRAIEVANMSSFSVENASFSVEDIAKLPEDWTKKYDAILLFDVLHDLRQPEVGIKEAMRVVKDDGILIIVDPKVSSNPKNNVGNLQAAIALTLSSWWCVPSTSCDHGSGLGVGWGWENKELFLYEHGLEVRSRITLLGIDFNYAYVCVKSQKVTGIRQTCL